MNPGESKIYMASALIGLTVFHGLGVAGVGTDYLAVLIATISEQVNSGAISRSALGVLTAGSVFLYIDGYLDARDGVLAGRMDK